MAFFGSRVGGRASAAGGALLEHVIAMAKRDGGACGGSWRIASDPSTRRADQSASPRALRLDPGQGQLPPP